ncbi:MAG: hypothetical protein L6425_10685 [Candidatus Aminicenantes bacterium]|nr:hypothetical protein [Candidatus Aminicenantes bacterium]
MHLILRDIFIRNWGLKLFSFLIALVLWLSFIPEEKIFSEKTVTVPLELHNIPPNIEVVESPIAAVTVKIRASRRLISRITAADVVAALELRQVKVNQENFPLTPDMILVPEGVEVKTVSPSQVMMKLEAIEEVFLKVEAVFENKMPEGYKLTQYNLIPTEVPVRGPSSKFKDSDTLKTQPIDRSNLTESREIVVGLILPNSDLSWGSSQREVRVLIQIQKIDGEAEDSASNPTAKKKAPKK